LFRVADTAGKGSIGGGEAVQFFARSKLPVEVLKNIWTVADQPSTSALDLKKFAVAVRLIQLTQNGQKGQGPSLSVAEGVTLRPAFFEGVSGVSVPLPPPPGGQRGPPPQQQHEAPLSPVMGQRSPTTQSMTPPTSLVAQDPYTMTPQERARYEDLFPQYANPDGFIYGKEAVELFMKSGVNQVVLRNIWSLVDRPVDNRLDKLEFAIAMHLIVCISKKNLPPPQGNLPNSLKALKAASSAPAGVAQPPPMQPSKQITLSPRPAEIPSPPRPQSSMGLGHPASFQSTAPPSIVSTVGTNISDAFEGLSMTSGAPSVLPSYVPEEPQQPAFTMRAAPEEPMSTPASFEIPNPSPERAPLTPPRSNTKSSKTNAGDSDLEKLKTVLQKLQAENISLKAQLGNMTDDEKASQKELSSVVAEIGSLSTELQTRRAQVLQAKTRLLEVSAELKAAHDRKG
jgi:Cytoskeletal-regulatory complex EF hand